MLEGDSNNIKTKSKHKFWTLKLNSVNKTRFNIYILISIVVVISHFGHQAYLGTKTNNIIQQNKNVEATIQFIEKQKTQYKVEEVSKTIISLQPKLDHKVAKIIAKAIVKYAKEYEFPNNLIVALAFRESSFRLFAISNMDCKGIMQINSESHKEKLKELNIQNGDIYHIDNNINLGCWILREYFDEYEKIEIALKRYVGGKQPGYVKDILAIFTNLELEKISEGEGDK